MNFQGIIFPLQNPNGTVSFVGNVPVDLAYTQPDGTMLTPDIMRTIALCGPGLVRDQIRARLFDSVDEAVSFLERWGFSPVTTRAEVATRGMRFTRRTGED